MSQACPERRGRTKRIGLTIVLLALSVGLIALMLIDTLPLLEQVIKNYADESVTQQYLEAYGASGAPALVALQALQVITAFFPAPPIQALTGLAYGIWFGLLINLSGLLLGNVLVFSMVRHADHAFGHLLPRSNKEPKERLLSIEHVRRLKRPGLVVAILYFMPGMPSGLVPYVFARTDMKLLDYLGYVLIGALPATILGVGFGTALSSGNGTIMTVLIVILAIVIVCALLFRKRILSYVESFST